MRLLVLMIRSMGLMNVRLSRQKELLRDTNSSDSLASSGLFITCQLTDSVVKEKEKNIHQCQKYAV